MPAEVRSELRRRHSKVAANDEGEMPCPLSVECAIRPNGPLLGRDARVIKLSNSDPATQAAEIRPAATRLVNFGRIYHRMNCRLA